jgi:hypothetical protein
MLYEYQNKGLANRAVRKWLKRKGGRPVASDEWPDQEKSKLPSPLFLVNVASKGLSICVSRLESTVARGSQVLIPKELAQRSTVDSSKLKVNCGEKNPRTGLRPMRGTKVDDGGSKMRFWEERAGDTRQFS